MRTDRELKQIALDMNEGKIVVFSVNPKYPLPEGFTVSFEYLNEQTERGFFFSCQYLTAEEEKKIVLFGNRWRELRRTFFDE